MRALPCGSGGGGFDGRVEKPVTLQKLDDLARFLSGGQPRTPSRPVHVENLADAIRDRLSVNALPREEPVKTRQGYGSGQAWLGVLELPYDANEMSIIVFLPRRADGLADLEKTLSAARVTDWLTRLLSLSSNKATSPTTSSPRA
jgi:hypothetical protein